MLDWEPVARASEYKLIYNCGLISNEIILKNTESNYSFPMANIYDPNIGGGLNTILNYTIVAKNNIGESDKSYSGTIRPFGDGSSDNPYRIINKTTFFDIQDAVGFNYFMLVGDVDLDKFDLANNFDFYGYLDGNGKSISYEQVDIPTASTNWGLFESIPVGSTIDDLSVNASILVSGYSDSYIGVIAGNVSGVINNCRTSGEISSSSQSYVGGITGIIYSGGVISNSMSSVQIQCNTNIGGIAGRIESGTVSNSVYKSTNGITNLSGNGNLGGITGNNNSGQVINCDVIAKLSAQGAMGGIAGLNSGVGNISYCTFNGTLSGMDFLGGISGSNGTGCTIIYSEANCEISGYHTVGGITGSNNGFIETSTSNSQISASSFIDDSNIGGIAGINSNTAEIKDSIVTGSVTGKNTFIGGVVGSNTGIVENSLAYCDVTSTDNISSAFVGGLVGFHSSGSISFSKAYGNISSSGDKVGGLVGECNSTLFDCEAFGNVTGKSQIGGLIGDNAQVGVSNCHAYGLVTGLTTAVGSLIGFESEIIPGYSGCTSNLSQTPSIPVIGY